MKHCCNLLHEHNFMLHEHNVQHKMGCMMPGNLPIIYLEVFCECRPLVAILVPCLFSFFLSFFFCIVVIRLVFSCSEIDRIVHVMLLCACSNIATRLRILAESFQLYYNRCLCLAGSFTMTS